MDLSQIFKDYLFSQGSSQATVKNYIADVKRFIRWFENKFSLPFKPNLVTWEMIEKYKEDLVSDIGQRSVDRHISSLRRFFTYLATINLVETNPLVIPDLHPKDSIEHLSKLKEFKDYLYRHKSSDLTIKNYIIDVRQFFSWFETTQKQLNPDTTNQEVVASLRTSILEEYKQKLIHQSDLSVPSINRKLSSLRVYFRFAEEAGLVSAESPSIDIKADQVANIPSVTEEDIQNNAFVAFMPTPEKITASETEPDMTPTYSRFPPLRLMQKTLTAGNLVLDLVLITPLAQGVSYCQYVLWARSGAKVFEKIGLSQANQTLTKGTAIGRNIPNISSDKTYLKRQSSLRSSDLALQPNWFKRYHTSPIIRRVHTGVLMATISLAVLLIYNETVGNKAVLGTQTDKPSRTLSFKGTLADDYGSPITDTKAMRFSLYSNPVATGEAQLWQEVVYVTPNQSGDFTVELGGQEAIPEDIFLSGDRLYIGVSVETEAELAPRQPIANVHLASQAQTLQGLLPITATNATTENVVLALDSTGDLVIGGDKSHTFKATGGTFELSGKNMLLSTTRGSNGNITFSPHGQGVVDIRKPIQNNSEDIIGDGPKGAVLINDLLSISASGSGQSVLTISQNGFGPLISASSGGQTRFAVDNIGSTTIGHNLTIDGTDIVSRRSVFNLLNRNVAIINFAGESEAVTIGSHSGTTTIRNARTAISGDLTVSGTGGQTFSGENAGITFSGSGNHTLTASSGSLKIGSNLTLNENISIVPESTNGINNLGSSDKPFDTLYVNTIVSPSLTVQNAQNQFLKNLGSLYAQDITNDILIGGNATASALIKLSGTADSPSFFQTNVGIGTTNPLYKLHVSQNVSGDAVALIENTDSSSNSTVLKLKTSALPAIEGTTFIDFINGTGSSSGAIRTTGSPSGPVISYETAGSDFAEYFKKEDIQEPMSPGDAVCLGNLGGVTRCDSTHTTIVGVITDRAGFVGASDKRNNPAYVLVGLHGQIDVRVLASEHIQPGDSLTFSDTKGILKKANEKSYILGRSLSSSGGSTKVLAYVNPGLHDPSVSITNKGNLSVIPIVNNQDNTTSYVVMDTINNKIVGTIGGFSDVVAGSVKTGILTARDIIVDGGVTVGGTLVASALKAQDLTADTAKISDTLIAKVLEADNVSASEKIVAPIIETDTIKVNILSPVSDDGITLHLQKKRVAFVSGNSQKTVASIDDEGNAQFDGTVSSQNASISGVLSTNTASVSGTLSSSAIQTQSLDVSGSATISGTLHVKDLIADHVNFSDEVLDAIVSKLSSRMMAEIASLISIGATENDLKTLLEPLVEEELLATASSTLTPTPMQNQSSSESGTLSSDIVTDSVQSASLSAFTNLTDTLISDKIVVNQSLMAYGPTSLSDASILGMLSIGGNMTIQNGSINTLGQTLEIQPLRQGNISLMAGKIMIDTQGNAVFYENVTVKGTLFTNTLSPERGENLNVKLDDNESLVVSSSSDSANVTFTGFGDLIASGSGKFSEVLTNNLKVIRGASADTSFTQTVASGSAGVATIVPYETERTILTPFVKEDSLIYLTPASETYGTTPFVARQTAEDPRNNTKGSFTIKIQSPLAHEIKVNWWIIN